VITSALAYYRDTFAKTTVILYDFEPEFQKAIERFYAAFEHMNRNEAIWHIEAAGQVNDRKYHAGASALVQRRKITLKISNPPFVKTNVQTPCIPVGRQMLYFFPDKLLIFESNGIGAVSYENLRIEIKNERFIEEEKLPSDAQVVDTTWKFVNKKGGPDRRFRNNRQLPIALYEGVHFSSDTGLNEKIMLSSVGRAHPFAQMIQTIQPIKQSS
jgi:hypothetical protein